MCVYRRYGCVVATKALPDKKPIDEAYNIPDTDRDRDQGVSHESLD